MNRAWISVAAFVVLCAVGCDRGDSPSSVAEKFYEEMAAGNIEAAKAISTPQTGALLDKLAASQGTKPLGDTSGRKAIGETIDGDTAQVSFTSDTGSTAVVPMTKVDGQWKVDFSSVVSEAAAARQDR